MKKIILFLTLSFCIFLNGCSNKYYPPAVHQPLESVTKIELLDCHSGYSDVIIYTLSEDEIKPFWDKLMNLEFRRYLNDPSTSYGILAIKIHYENEYYDIIGADVSKYYSPNNCQYPIRYTYHYIADEQSMLNLFSEYVDSSILPYNVHFIPQADS